MRRVFGALRRFATHTARQNEEVVPWEEVKQRLERTRRDSQPATRKHLHAAFALNSPNRTMRIYHSLYQQGLTHLLSPEDHSTLLGLCTEHAQPHIAISHAAQILSNLNAPPDMRDHHALLTCFLRANDHDSLLAHLNSMRTDYSLKPSLKCFNLLMASYLHRKDTEGVVNTWKTAIATYPASRYTNIDAWAILIEAHGLNDITMAKKLYDEISNHCEKHFPNPTLDSPGKMLHLCQLALIRSYGYAGDLASAKPLRYHIRPKNWQDDPRAPSKLESLDAFIAACLSCNDADRALRLWYVLKQECETMDEVLGIGKREATTPDLDTVNGVQFLSEHYIVQRRHCSPAPITIERFLTGPFPNDIKLEIFEEWVGIVPMTNASFEAAVWAYIETGQNLRANRVYYLMLQWWYLPTRRLDSTMRELRSRFRVQNQGLEAPIDTFYDEWYE